MCQRCQQRSLAGQPRRDSPNGHYGIFESGLPCQSALMPTNFTTLPHFSVSLAISFSKPAGESASTPPPCGEWKTYCVTAVIARDSRIGLTFT